MKSNVSSAQHSPPLEKGEKIFLQNTTAFCVILILFAAPLCISSAKYPLVSRQGNSLGYDLLIYLAIAVSIILIQLIKYWTYKRSHLSRALGRTFSLYLILSSPTIIGFVNLGLTLNGALDNSQEQTFETEITNKMVSRGGRGGPQWYLHFRDWRQPSKTVQLSLSESEYDQYTIGTPMRFTTKSGYLGYEWRVSYSAIRQ